MTFTILNKGCPFSSWFHKEHSNRDSSGESLLSRVQSLSDTITAPLHPLLGSGSQGTTTLTYGFHRLTRHAEQLTESSGCRGLARKAEARLDEACSSMTTGKRGFIHSKLPLSPERPSNFREPTTRPPHSCQNGLEAACLSAMPDPRSAADAISHSLGLVLPNS